MQIAGFLFEPTVFLGLLGVIFIVSVFVIRYINIANRAMSEEKEQNIRKEKVRIAELEQMVVDRDEEHKRKLAQLENISKNREQELRKRVMELEAQLKDGKQLTGSIGRLGEQLKEKEGLLKRETAAKEELNKKINILQDELAKFKADLSLKTQMYEGLKGQYEELEKEVARLTSQARPPQPPPSKTEESAG